MYTHTYIFNAKLINRQLEAIVTRSLLIITDIRIAYTEL